MVQGNELERLENFVSKLIDKNKMLQDKTNKLEDLVTKKIEEINELEDQLSALSNERGEVVTRIGGLIDQIEEWEQDLTGLESEDIAENTNDLDRRESLSVEDQTNLFSVESQNKY